MIFSEDTTEAETVAYPIERSKPRSQWLTVARIGGHIAAFIVVGIAMGFGFGLSSTTPAISNPGHAIEFSRATLTKMPFDHTNSMAASGWPAIPSTTREAVFRIRVGEGSGSGVAIGPQLIITARHVVQGSDAQVGVDIFNEFGVCRSINGIVVALDDESDLALIRVSEDLPAVAVLGLDEARTAAPGDPLVCVGSTAGGTAWNSTAGYLSAKGAPDIDNTFWQMSVPIFFGNSGGAVYETRTWRLVGISVAMNSFCSTYFIPAHTVQAFVKRAENKTTGVYKVPSPQKSDGATKDCAPMPPIQPFVRRKTI